MNYFQPVCATTTKTKTMYATPVRFQDSTQTKTSCRLAFVFILLFTRPRPAEIALSQTDRWRWYNIFTGSRIVNVFIVMAIVPVIDMGLVGIESSRLLFVYGGGMVVLVHPISTMRRRNKLYELMVCQWFRFGKANVLPWTFFLALFIIRIRLELIQIGEICLRNRTIWINKLCY